MDTVTTDSNQCVKIPDAFPGQVFAFKNNGDGTRTLTEMKPASSAGEEIKPIKQANGLYLLPVKLERAEILAAIRSDRNSR